MDAKFHHFLVEPHASIASIHVQRGLDFLRRFDHDGFADLEADHFIGRWLIQRDFSVGMRVGPAAPQFLEGIVGREQKPVSDSEPEQIPEGPKSEHLDDLPECVVPCQNIPDVLTGIPPLQRFSHFGESRRLADPGGIRT